MFENLKASVIAAGGSWEDFVYENSESLMLVMMGMPSTEALADVDTSNLPGVTVSSIISTANNDAASTGKFFLNHTARVYNFANSRWVTDSSANYGTSYVQNYENCGNGANPQIKWTHQGEFIKKGTKVHSLTITGRANTQAQFKDLEIYALFKAPDMTKLTGVGYSSNSQHTVTDLYRNKWMTPTDGLSSFTNINRFHLREYALNFTAPSDGQLSIYFKPVRGQNGGATRIFYYQSSWCVSNA